MKNLLLILAIGIGGAFGAICRASVSLLLSKFSQPIFPWATFCVNILGSFLIGICWVYSDKYGLSIITKYFLITGFLGAFTTFSTFSFETFSLITDGHTKTAIIYVTSSLLIGLASVFTGAWVAKQI